MDMARFESVDDPGFVSVTGELRRWVRELTEPGIDRVVDETSGQCGSQEDRGD